MNSVRSRNWSFFVILVVTASIAVVAVYGLTLYRNFNSVHDIWIEYEKNAVKVNSSLANLKSNIGYGGFIHNFKNYVLRRDKKYIPVIEKDKASILASTKFLHSVLSSKKDQKKLAIIEQTFIEYFIKFVLAQQLVASGAEQSIVDERVRVDDGAALAAFEALQQNRIKESASIQSQVAKAMDHANQSLLYGFAIIIFLTASGIGGIILIRAISKAYIKSDLARRELDNFFNTAPDALIRIKMDGTIVKANEEAINLFGYSFSHMVGMKIEELMPQKYRSNHQNVRAAYFQTRERRPMGVGLELLALTRDGKEFNVDVSLSYSLQDGEEYATAAIRDITDKFKIQRELDITNERSKAAAVAKARLLSNMSHELRTPLNHILGFGELLLNDTKHPPRENQREMLQHILNSGQHQLKLVESTLELAELDNTPLKIEPFDVGLEIRKGVKSQEIEATGKGISFDINIGSSVPQEFRGSRLCFRNVLAELLSNSIKFMDEPQGKILVSASFSDENLEVLVEDNGPGITDDRFEDIFLAFERLDAFEKAIGGIGVGLTTARQLVDNMGGTMRAENTEKGARIFFSIPDSK
ncbi:MAG: PAS domain-containing sensor histidine kinase [Rhodospirillaceae bacterium]|jgi:PAS domain S-box-containing protein|nr:PAS domain-containing sensor histidine kinase [Rhodospirillaceae bacterium]